SALAITPTGDAGERALLMSFEAPGVAARWRRQLTGLLAELNRQEGAGFLFRDSFYEGYLLKSSGNSGAAGLLVGVGLGLVGKRRGKHQLPGGRWSKRYVCVSRDRL